MLRIFLFAVFAVFSSGAMSMVVIDPSVLAQAVKISENTTGILKMNTEILKTVNAIKKACTGKREKAASSNANLAVSLNFNVSSTLSLQKTLSESMPNLDKSQKARNSAETFLRHLKIRDSISGKTENNKTSTDASYEEMMKTVYTVSALVKGTLEAAVTRKDAFKAASKNVGTTADIKGSIDASTQMQVQLGLTINEMINVLNGAVASLQAQNQRQLTNMSSMRNALSYGN